MTIPLHRWIARGRQQTSGPGPVTGPVLPPTGVTITDPAVIGPQGISLIVHPEIGYEAIGFNGQGSGAGNPARTIAVGGQLNAPSDTGPGAGPPVTCAGASESFDCGRTWRDMTLPFDGQKERWQHVAYVARRHIIASRYFDNGTPVSNLMYAFEKPAGETLEWKPCGPVTFGSRRGLNITWVGGFFAGSNQYRAVIAGAKNNVPFVAYSNALTDTLDGALEFPFTDISFAPKGVVTAGFATADTTERLVLLGLNQVIMLRRGAGTSIEAIGSETAPWGSAATSTAAYVYSAARSSSLALAVVSDSFNFTGFSGDYPPGKRACLLNLPFLQWPTVGVTWNAAGFNWSTIAPFTTLPGSPSFEGAAAGGFSGRLCIVGHDRNTFASQVAYAPQDSAAFTGYPIPESRAWQSVAYTNGWNNPGGFQPNFVACSRDGHLLCLNG